MKINQTANSPNNIASQAATGNKQSPSRAQINHAPASAAVSGSAHSASPLATQVRQLQSQLTQPGSGDFNAAKVAQIRQAISAGRYQINTGKIADGLLDTVRDLLSKPVAR